MDENLPQQTNHDHVHVTVATLNGHDIVAGLVWEKLRNVKSYMVEARLLGKELGMDIVAIRKGADDERQAGFAPKGQGAIKNMYSMAAVVAAIAGPDSLVAFELEDGRYGLVGTLDGLIIAGCDAIGERDEIESLFRDWHSRAISTGRIWKRVAAPPEFEFSDEAFDLDAELDKQAFRREHRLQQLTFGLSKAEILRYAVIGGALTAFGVGCVVVKAYLDKKNNRPAAVNVVSHIAPPPAPIKLPHPWAKVPTVESFIAVCQSNVQPFPLSIAGYVLATRDCTNGRFSGDYLDPGHKASSATSAAVDARVYPIPFADFAAAVKRRFGVVPGPTTPGQFDKSGVVASFNPLPGSDADLLPPAMDAQANFVSHFQALGIVPQLDATDKAVEESKKGLPPDQMNSPNVPKPDWHTYNFTIVSDVNPEILFSGIDSNGLRVTEIKSDLNAAEGKFKWTITGAIYAR